MSKGKVVVDWERPMAHAERNSLTIQKDKLVVMSICRVLGRTDWEFTDAILDRGKWVEYQDGEQVFSFDGKECFLLHVPEFVKEDNQWRQRYQWLFDIKDYEHHTEDDERG